jgi:hypothetical protein
MIALCSCMGIDCKHITKLNQLLLYLSSLGWVLNILAHYFFSGIGNVNYFSYFLLFYCCFTVHLVSSKFLCQQMHASLKHKMLKLTLKISLYMAPTCFGPFGPSSGSIYRNLAKVTVFVELLVKIYR